MATARVRGEASRAFPTTSTGRVAIFAPGGGFGRSAHKPELCASGLQCWERPRCPYHPFGVLARWRPADAPFSSTAPVLPDDDLRHRPCACRHTPKPYVCLHACLSWLRTCHESVGGAGFAAGLRRSSPIPLATGAGQGAEPGGTCVSGASAAGSTSRAHLDVDRYVRVEQRSNEQAAIQENEVRITAAGKMRNYISYATALVTVRPLSAALKQARVRCSALTEARAAPRRKRGTRLWCSRPWGAPSTRPSPLVRPGPGTPCLAHTGGPRLRWVWAEWRAWRGVQRC